MLYLKSFINDFQLSGRGKSLDGYEYKFDLDNVIHAQKFVIDAGEYLRQENKETNTDFFHDKEKLKEIEDAALPFEAIWIEMLNHKEAPLKGLYINEVSPDYYEIAAYLDFNSCDVTPPSSLLPTIKSGRMISLFHGSIKDAYGEMMLRIEEYNKHGNLYIQDGRGYFCAFGIIPQFFGFLSVMKMFSRNSEFSTAYENVDYTFMLKKKNGKKKPHKISKIIHIYKKKSSIRPHPIIGGRMDFTHRWLVRGHWRKIHGIGKNRQGEYSIHNFTWVISHERGEGDLVSDKIRIFHNEETAHA